MWMAARTRANGDLHDSFFGSFIGGSPMIHPRFTELIGLKYPIMFEPMTLHSGGTLAAAVSKSGGLGSFGGLHPRKDTDWLTTEIARIRSITPAPFAVGF